MTMHSAVRFVVLVGMAALLAGCPSSKVEQTRDETLLAYEKLIRWSQWSAAVEFLAPEYLEENPMTRLDLDRLNLFRVTAYEAGQLAVGPDGLSIRQAVQIRLFNKNRSVERTIIDQQEWRYDAERERWLLHTGLPDVTRRY